MRRSNRSRVRPLRLFALLTLLAPVAHGAALTRGPFLQLAEAREVTVVFHTDVPSAGAVRFGALGGPLAGMVSEVVPNTVHALRLTGLTPSTRYAYEVVVDGQVLSGGEALRFRTSPPLGSAEPFRFFAWGDSGTGDVAQLQVAERLAAEVGDATFSLILGDIVYYAGEPQLYDARFFTPYAPLLRRSVVWPTIGNHDMALDPLGGPYRDAFHLPTNNPAGSELYYSFDYGDAHFVCLDTHVSGHAAGSAQLTWAAADLAASSAKWKIVFFHVPPYSGGTHADDPGVRDAILPVLEAAGVDVVFSGHSHVYERSFLLRSNAIVQGDRASYVKNIPGAGTLYVVSGTAGQRGVLSNPAHPLMAFQAGSVLGVSVVDVSGDALRGYFLQADGTAVDLFSLSKGADVTAPRLLGVRANSESQLEVSFDEPVLGADHPTAFEIVPPVTVRSAQVGSDRRTVLLQTDAHQPGTYELRAAGVHDDAGLSSSQGAAYVVREVIPLTSDLTRFVVDTAPPEWSAAGFDDSAWLEAPLPLGVGLPGVTLFARLHFPLPVARASMRRLLLELDYDDGFVASLNGVEVLRQNVPAGQRGATLANGLRTAGLVQHFTLAQAPASLLHEGDNVLALEVHDATGGFFLNARLRAELDERQVTDAGFTDAGLPVADAGAGLDAGLRDAGLAVDAGPLAVDAGPAPAATSSSCGCAQLDAAALVLLAALTCRRARGPG